MIYGMNLSEVQCITQLLQGGLADKSFQCSGIIILDLVFNCFVAGVEQYVNKQTSNYT